MLFLLAILFGLTTLGLVIAISFPMERRVSRMAKGTKRAMDRLDEAKGELWKARAKKSVSELDVLVAAVKRAVAAVNDAIANEKRATLPQSYAIIAAFWGGGLTVFFAVMGLLDLLHAAAVWAGFFLVLFGIAYYLVVLFLDLGYGRIEKRNDIDLVEEDEIGVKVILGRPYRVVSSGPRFAPTRFVRVVHIPTRVFLYKIREDNVLSAGAEAARWVMDITIRYRIDRDAWNLVRFFGTDVERIHKVLTEITTDANGKKVTRGIIGDEITSIARSWIGNKDNVATVDVGLSAQEQIAAVIDHDLELSLGLYGFSFDNANVTDLDVQEEVVKARTERTQALVGVGTAKYQADQRKYAGTGERDYQMAIAEADAFRAEQVIKAKIAALTSMPTKGQEWALNLLTLLVVGEEGLDKLKGLGNLNLFALEGIGGIVSQITSALGGGGGENAIVQLLKGLSPSEAEKIKKQLLNLMKGGKS